MRHAAGSTEKYVLLSAWYVIHGCGAYTLMFLLDTDIARARQQGGWLAVQHLLALLAFNAMLYTSLFKLTVGHRCKLHDAARCADNIFSSPLLFPVSNRHLTPTAISKQLSSGRGVVCLTVLASGDEDAANFPKQQDNMCFQGEGTSQTQHSSRQCTCPDRHATRVHHCRTCNVCVKGFDHHCHWLGGDVSQHNHGCFYVYLASQTSVCLYALHHALTAVRHAAHSAWSWQHAAVAGFAAMVLIAAILLFSLLSFHTFLILGNWKTYEVLRGARHSPAGVQDSAGAAHVGRRSLFDRGVVQNVYNFVCNRQLYDTPAEDWQRHDMAGAGSATCWDNSMYSCC